MSIITLPKSLLAVDGKVGVTYRVGKANVHSKSTLRKWESAGDTVMEIPNTPRILTLVDGWESRSSGSNYNRSGTKYHGITLQDEAGFKFNISAGNFMKVIDNTDIIGGVLQTKAVLVWETHNGVYPVFVGTPEYEKYSKDKTNVGKRELVVGRTYMVDGRNMVYLGDFPYYESSYGYADNYVWRKSKSKKIWFMGNDGDSLVLSNMKKVTECVDESTHEDLDELLKLRRKNSHAKRCIGFELEPCYYNPRYCLYEYELADDTLTTHVFSSLSYASVKVQSFAYEIVDGELTKTLIAQRLVTPETLDIDEGFTLKYVYSADSA